VAKERRTYGDQHPIYGCLFDVTPKHSLEPALTPLPTVFDAVTLPPLKPGTYFMSATHLQGIYLALWGPWTQKKERVFQDRGQAVSLLAPLSPQDRQRVHEVGPERFEQIRWEFQLLEYHRFLAHLREGKPDEVLNGAILVYRLDPAAFQSIMEAGPPAQAERFVE
jgi:hypothetical protein